MRFPYNREKGIQQLRRQVFTVENDGFCGAYYGGPQGSMKAKVSPGTYCRTKISPSGIFRSLIFQIVMYCRNFPAAADRFLWFCFGISQPGSRLLVSVPRAPSHRAM